ncbi:MAG: T9SS type A sorting domain-containing protein [Chlorobi bacterium]|nr:T9SS type A sorting domain-containing protein [Chlorobiota bacterium]
MKKLILFILSIFLFYSSYSQEYWKQNFELYNGYEEYDSLGISSAIWENLAISGAPGDENSSGYVRIMENEDDVWDIVQDIVSDDLAEGDRFGAAADMDGTYIIVGAPGEDHDTDGNNELSNSGSVYVFTYNSSSGDWEQFQKITASTRHENARFGFSVCLSGTDLIIGAPGDDYDDSEANPLDEAGAAYFYRYDGTQWVLRNKVVASDRAAGDNFGYDVSVSGLWAVIGAPFYDYDDGTAVSTDAGKAYIFKKSLSGWSQTKGVVANTYGAEDHFGWAVSVKENNMVISAPEYGFKEGLINYYYYTTLWTYKDEIIDPWNVNLDVFGTDVVADTNYIVVTCRNWGGHVNNKTGSGGLFIYGTSSGTLTFIDSTSNYYTDHLYDNGFVGYSADIYGDYIVAGAPFLNTGYTYMDNGGVYFFTHKPVFTQDPSPERWYNMCGDANAYFYVYAENYDSMIWQVSDDNGNTWVDIDTNLSNYSQYAYEQTRELFIDPLTGLNRNRYRCKITNDFGTTFSDFGAIYFSPTAPYLGTKDTTVYLDATGNITITPAFVVDSTSNGEGPTCHDSDTTLSVYDFDCSNIGANVIDVILTAYNELSSTEQATVTVIDSISPVISSANDTILYIDNSCEVLLPDFTLNVTATDNCTASVSLTQSPPAGTSLTSDLAVVITAEDESGNQSFVTFSVSVSDTIPPEITSSHSDQFVDADENCEAILPDYTGNVIVNDDCDTDLTITQDPVAGTTFSGLKTVTLTVTDDYGNTDEVSFGVRTKDVSPPVITSTHNDTVLYVNESCNFSLPDFTANLTATDNCSGNYPDKGDGLNAYQTPTAGTIYTVGDEVEVKLKIIDDESNADSVMFTVSVTDTISPVISSTHNDITVSGDADCEYTLPDYTGDVIASDNCDASLDISQNPAPGTVITGYADLTLSVTDDSGNTANVTFSVTLEDTEIPELTTKNTDLYLDASGYAYLLPSDVVESASDNCALADTVLSKTEFGTSDTGENSVTVTLFDATGNSVSADAIVTVYENTGISETNNAVKIYPNPAGDYLFIEIGFNNSEITISDISGRILFETKTNERKIKIDLNNYPKGIYIIETKIGKKLFYKKVVKK